MTSNLPARQASSIPIPTTLDRAHSAALSIMRNNLIRKPNGELFLEPRGVPSASERAWMTARVDELSWCLSPAPIDAIRVEIAKLFTALASRTGDENDIRSVQAVFCESLADQPLFAIKAAVLAYCRGQAGEGRWAPTPPELRRVVITKAALMRKEACDLEDILRAKPLEIGYRPATPEERRASIERIRGKAAEVADALNPFPPAKKAPDFRNQKAEQAAAEAQLNAVADRLRSPVRVSEALAERLAAG